MSRETADEYLSRHHGELSAEEHIKLVGMALDIVTVPEMKKEVAATPPAPKPIRYDPFRRRFMALAWLAGASWNQLAAMYDITRQTILDQMNRILPAHEREKYVGRRSKLTYEQLYTMRVKFLSDPIPYGGENLFDAALLLREDAAAED